MKVAIVHYWLVGMRGGEKVIEALCEMYPQADISPTSTFLRWSPNGFGSTASFRRSSIRCRARRDVQDLSALDAAGARAARFARL
jgi:hypothetical protein